METVEDRIEKFKKLNAYRQDAELWKKKGFQVIMSVYTAGKMLGPVIQSLDLSMKGLDWILLLGDDGSIDDSVNVAKGAERYCSAKEYKIFEFERAGNVSKAKNRLAKISKEYSEDYPGILFCDADDFTYEGKAEGLYKTAKQKNANLTIGHWLYVNKRLKINSPKTAEESLKKLTFGPWNTLIHSSLIPEDGVFWNEKISVHADLLMWWELMASDVEFTLSDTKTTKYNATYGSISKDINIIPKKEGWQDFEAAREEIIRYGNFGEPVWKEKEV